jgi:hypothetical protein
MQQETDKIMQRLQIQVSRLGWIILLLLALAVWIGLGSPGWNNSSDQVVVINETTEEDEMYLPNPELIGQLDDETGMVIDRYWELTKAQCTSCHSSSVFVQTRATREGWSDMIDWMQTTQGLWDLGEHEPRILDYLEKHYGISENTRSHVLKIDEWYEIR